MAEPENGSSPLAEALARVGDRWTLLGVEALLGGPQRFNDLLGQIPGIAANILSERLKRLEREGLLIARPYSERPPRAAYQLTAEGTELARARRLLAHGGQACRPDWFHDWLHEGLVVSGVSQVERQGLEP